MKTLYLAFPAFIFALVLNICLASPLQAESGSQRSTPVLYYSSSCSHCHKVLDYVDRNNVHVIKKNIQNPSYRQELVRLGANSVPVMVVDSRVIKGSSPIISYLRSNN